LAGEARLRHRPEAVHSEGALKRDREGGRARLLMAQPAPEANGAILILQGGANKGIKAFDRDGKP